LTARYVELLLNDRRSLLMLLLQAPIVALFLLVGFAHKPYQEKMLAPRRLSEKEREALAQVQHMIKGISDSTDVVSPEALGLANLKQQHPELVKALDRLNGSKVLDNLQKTSQPVLPTQEITNPRFTYMLLYITAITVLWFGCNNASKEIVKEEAIYGRERAVN